MFALFLLNFSMKRDKLSDNMTERAVSFLALLEEKYDVWMSGDNFLIKFVYSMISL